MIMPAPALRTLDNCILILADEEENINQRMKTKRRQKQNWCVQLSKNIRKFKYRVWISITFILI